MDDPGASASASNASGAAGAATPDTLSRRYSVHDIDVLDAYLSRLDKLSSALPPKSSLPNSPRSPGQRFQIATSIASGLDNSGTQSPLLRTGSSSSEASPRPSSTLEPLANYIAASSWLTGSLPIRRVRSKSLSDGASGAGIASLPNSSQPTSPTAHKGSHFPSNAGRRVAAPIDRSSLASPSARKPSDHLDQGQTATSPQRANTILTAVPTDKFGRHRKLKRRSVPTPLATTIPSSSDGVDNSLDSAKSESVDLASLSIAEGSEGEADISDIEPTGGHDQTEIAIQGAAEVDENPPRDLQRSDTLTETLASANCRTRRAMTSPLTSPPLEDQQPFRPISASTSLQQQRRPSTASSQTRLQARSPFSAPGSPEWRKRHFPRQASTHEIDEDQQEMYHGSGKRRDMLTATEALAELGRQTPMESAAKPRVRKLSRESYSSKGSSLFDRAGKAAEDPRRESIDSRASSNHSIRLFARNGAKTPSVPASQTQSFGSIYSQASPVAATSSGNRSQQPRRPRLEARDDRIRSTRPRFASTRSTSSLPLSGEHDSSPYNHAQTLSSDDEFDLRNPRRASIPNALLSYNSPTLLKANRASLAVPPPFGRSYSYDDRGSASPTSPSHGGDEKQPRLSAHSRDMEQAVLLWIPDEAAWSAKGSHGRQLTKVLLGNVPRKKVTKRDSKHVLSTTNEGRSSTAKGKEKAKDRLSSATPAGRWRECQAVLKPTGQLELFSEVGTGFA